MQALQGLGRISMFRSCVVKHQALVWAGHTGEEKQDCIWQDIPDALQTCYTSVARPEIEPDRPFLPEFVQTVPVPILWLTWQSIAYSLHANACNSRLTVCVCVCVCPRFKFFVSIVELNGAHLLCGECFFRASCVLSHEFYRGRSCNNQAEKICNDLSKLYNSQASRAAPRAPAVAMQLGVDQCENSRIPKGCCCHTYFYPFLSCTKRIKSDRNCI